MSKALLLVGGIVFLLMIGTVSAQASNPLFPWLVQRPAEPDPADLIFNNPFLIPFIERTNFDNLTVKTLLVIDLLDVGNVTIINQEIINITNFLFSNSTTILNATTIRGILNIDDSLLVTGNFTVRQNSTFEDTVSVRHQSQGGGNSFLSNVTGVETCTDSGSPATCLISEVNASDDSYAGNSGTGVDSLGSLASIIVNLTDDVTNGITLDTVELNIEWNVNIAGTCSIDVYNGTWERVTDTCPGSSDQMNTFSVISILSTEALIEGSKVAVNYTSGGASTLKIDFIQIVINSQNADSPQFSIESVDGTGIFLNVTGNTASLYRSGGVKIFDMDPVFSIFTNMIFDDGSISIAGIQNQNLLDLSAVESITGNYSFTDWLQPQYLNTSIIRADTWLNLPVDPDGSGNTTAEMSQAVNDSGIMTGYGWFARINISDTSNITLTESQITDLSHTTNTDGSGNTTAEISHAVNISSLNTSYASVTSMFVTDNLSVDNMLDVSGSALKGSFLLTVDADANGNSARFDGRIGVGTSPISTAIISAGGNSGNAGLSGVTGNVGNTQSETVTQYTVTGFTSQCNMQATGGTGGCTGGSFVARMRLADGSSHSGGNSALRGGDFRVDINFGNDVVYKPDTTAGRFRANMGAGTNNTWRETYAIRAFVTMGGINNTINDSYGLKIEQPLDFGVAVNPVIENYYALYLEDITEGKQGLNVTSDLIAMVIEAMDGRLQGPDVGNVWFQGGDWNTGNLQLNTAHIWATGGNISFNPSEPGSATDAVLIIHPAGINVTGGIISSHINVTGTSDNSTFLGDVMILGTLYGGSPVEIAGINITDNIFSHMENINSSMRFTLQNLNAGTNATAVISALNDVGGSMSIGIGSSNFVLDSTSYSNLTALFSRSRGSMVFANFYNQPFIWLDNPSDDNNPANLVEVMRLDSTGLNISGNLTGNLIYGEIWFNNDTANGVEVIISSAGAWVNVSFDQELNSGQSLNGFEFVNGNALKALVAGKYKADHSLSFEMATGANDEYHTTISINDVIQNQTETHRLLATANDVGDTSGAGFIDLAVGDIVNMQIQNEDTTANAGIHAANLNLIRIGD